MSFLKAYFDIIVKGESARCKVPACKKSVVKGANTSNMRSHLKVHHPKLYKDVLENEVAAEKKKEAMAKRGRQIFVLVDDPAASGGQGSTNEPRNLFKPVVGVQSKLPGAFTPPLCGAEAVAVQEDRQKVFLGKCAKLIAGYNLPFNFVENPQFRDICSFLQSIPSKCAVLDMPGRELMRQVTIPQMCLYAKKCLREVLEGCEHCSLTSDHWTSLSQKDFATVTVHFINNNFERKSAMLGCYSYGERQTADNIEKRLKQTIKEFRLEGKVHTVVRDNALNMVQATARLGSVNCTLHCLNLVVQHGLKSSQRSIIDMRARARNLVNKIRSSCKRTREFEEVQKALFPTKQTRRLKIACETRWGSEQDQLETLLDLQIPVDHYALVNRFPAEACPTKNDWNLMAKVVGVLKAVHRATLYLESEAVCVSEIIPAIKKMCLDIEQVDVTGEGGCGTFKDDILTYIRYYFYGDHAGVNLITQANFETSIEQLDNYRLATGLDPRFKLGFFTKKVVTDPDDSDDADDSDQPDYKQLARDKLRSVLASALRRRLRGKGLATAGDSLTRKRGYYDGMECENDEEKDSVDDKVDRQLLGYLTSAKLTCDDEVVGIELDWWRQNCGLYPDLANLARKYLSAPASSAASERVFKQASLICTNRRNRLLAGNTSDLLFLKYNIRALNLPDVITKEMIAMENDDQEEEEDSD